MSILNRYNEINERYQEEFNDKLPVFGLDDKQLELVLREAEKAINGEKYDLEQFYSSEAIY